MGVKKKNQDVKDTEPKISYFQIFRYATFLEMTATIFGVLLGLLSGGGVTFCLIQIGEISTSFVERTSGYQDRLSSKLPLTEVFGGGRRLFNASHEENMEALLEDGKAMAGSIFAGLLISVLLIVISTALISWSSMRQITTIRNLFLRSVLRQDMSWFDLDTEFNLASQMSENLVKIKNGMGDKLTVVSNLLGTTIISLAITYPLGWELALACTAVMPFSIAASVMLSNYQTKSSIHEMESYSQAGKQAEEVLKSVRTIVGFAGERKEIDRYRTLLEPAERYGRKRGFYNGVGNAFNWILTYSLNAIGISYGTRLLIADLDKSDDERRYIVGIVFSILMSAYMSVQSITLCVPHMETFAAARGAAASIFPLLDQVPKIDSLSTEGLSPRRVIGELKLEDVHFSYPSRPDIKVLNGFSLHVKPAESVALVGSSGCGKSTILQLLQRLYEPLSGCVKLDNRDIKSLNTGWLRSSFGVVGQEPVLFQGTIYNNIAIGCPEASRDDVRRVAEMAYAHDFILNLPNGYDTVIGERGASLSGGQKQRIAIARSLLREPAVLLLDEATSALDSQSERQVQAALDRASKGRTTLTVSHRLSTIVNADRIICMDQGCIVEQGTHDELMQAKGFFYKLATTGKEDALEESYVEQIEDKLSKEPVAITKPDVKRMSTRRVYKHHPHESHKWMTPRGSVSSVMSTGFQNFICDAEVVAEEEEQKSEEDDEMKSINNWELLKLNSPEWLLMFIGSVAAFIQGACFPMFALIFGYTSGIYILTDRDKIVYLADFYSGMFLIVATVAGVSMCIQGVSFTSSGLKMTTRLRHQYFAALLNQEIGFFDKASNTVGAICARLSGDAAEVQDATGLMVGLILQGFSSVFIGVVMSLFYDWKLTLVSVVFLPIIVGSIWLEGIVSQKSQIIERAEMESATSIATEAILSIKTVQSLDGSLLAILGEHWSSRLSARHSAFSSSSNALVLSGLSRGGMLERVSAFRDLASCQVTEAVMYGAYMLAQSLTYVPSFNSAKSSAARIVSVIKRQPKIKTEDNIKDIPNWVASGSFTVKEVEFNYPSRPNQPILRGISLKVEAGKTVALVGASGCGKSTILQLIQRFYDPSTGNIELDDRDIRYGLTLPRLRRQLGVVQQEPVLFDRTIAENIAYGDNNRKVPMNEIIAAAKAANIHSFIVSLSKGYDTKLGVNGAQLSGGQKQRICIARALIRSPRLLLLDEATSALDTNSERVVSEALEKAAMGRTCITIAHRLSTIKNANLICVVDKGKIVEQGTHSQLLNLKGHYYRMSKGQNIA
ncbi:hypothetical protein K1T71_000209 [Dendrolimus kikuchii]|uniref:Uncharacterized protein n=1 Tax=Dendrolimus kikuchii TaxID=765133 RepID=A0ACC1DIX2_9NEOP|nr:hypothetical protein K1T71_000209 [Dendrolimus kikuchii]